MHWVYILKDEEQNNIYVGETKRLYRRFFEHQNGSGSYITSTGEYDMLVGLYRVPINSEFYNYHEQNHIYNDHNPYLFKSICDITKNETYKEDALLVENWITENIINNTQVFNKVYGGKYYNMSTYKNMVDKCKRNTILERPFCHCGVPAEIKISTKGELYYTCSLKNTWDGIGEIMDVGTPCSFFMKYNNIESKTYYTISRKNAKNTFFSEIPPAFSDMSPGSCVICDKYSYFPVWSPTCGSKRVCSECMTNKLEYIEKKYTKCMFFD